MINKKLLPVKLHFFFFYAALGPIFPQLPVYGKELGISSVVMGTVTGILPFAFLVAKPAFGVLVDMCRRYRKCIFITLVAILALSFAAIYFIPQKPLLKLIYEPSPGDLRQRCDDTDIERKHQCTSQMMICSSDCRDEATTVLVTIQQDHICVLSHHFAFTNQTCEFTCEEDADTSSRCLYRTFPFWSFVTFMYVGCIGANVIMSITDAICFDIIGADGDYGRQRVWATVGYGVAALLSGYISTLFPQDGSTTYAPAFIIMLISVLIDIAICAKLKLPVIQAPKNMIKEFKHLLKDGVVVTFLTFATFVGILDSLIIFFLLWYLEDLAVATNTENIKLIEGLTVAAEALGGEIIFFFISKKILNRFGHVNCFSACFFFYALRIGLISLAPSPWWIIPIEFCLNGPTFAMAYSAIVAYANDLAPAGASATMQGIAAGMDDGLGFAVGSFVGGSLFKYIGAKYTLYVFSGFGFFCCIAHVLLHKTILRRRFPNKRNSQNVEYKSQDRIHETTC